MEKLTCILNYKQEKLNGLQKRAIVLKYVFNKSHIRVKYIVTSLYFEL